MLQPVERESLGNGCGLGQEKALANLGWFYIMLMLSVTAWLVAFYIWVNRASDAKDAATLENFETFISAKMHSLEFSHARVPPVLLSADHPAALPPE